MSGRRIQAIGIGWVCAGLALAQPGGEVQTITGFRVPSYDREGNLTSQMFGEQARILPDGTVEIADLSMEFFGSNDAGTNRPPQMRVTSPRCHYDRASGVATSAASVRIARDNMVVTGVGFRWAGESERLEIFSEAKVVLKDARRSVKAEAKK